MANADISIDSDRLRALLDGVNAFGRDAETGGFNRIGYSDADMDARRWVAEEMRQDGLSVRTDAVANVFGRYGPEDGACVMIGSHLDTVPNGGAFDGALGACVALECVRAMRDAGWAPERAVVVVATAEEEGRFGGMLGSQAIAGQVTDDWIAEAKDAEGARLADALRAQGLAPEDAPRAAWRHGDVAAFLELHIEQGPVLEAEGVPIGVATAVSGVCNLFARFEGVANHSGATPMHLRADAFAGLTQVASRLEGILRTHGTDEARATIGQVEIRPNFPHTIPGVAEFSVILRDTEEAALRALDAATRAAIADAAAARGLRHAIEERSWLPPVALDRGLQRMLMEEAAAMGAPATRMPSGAGHDAQTMQALCPSGLVFIPSRGGVSHAPDEWSDWEDILVGAQLMLRAVIRLCGAR